MTPPDPARRPIPATLSPTQFAWAVADAGDYPPPAPRRGPRYGPDPQCWLCGGDTDGVGWHQSAAIAPTFCDHNEARCPLSRTVCQPCVATSRSDGWGQYVRAHPDRGFAEYFPAKPNTKPRAWNWLYSSHLFAAPHHHECPDRGRWRDILLEPPEPPFLAVIATSGQKHGIFRGQIARSRDLYPVQADARRLWVERGIFRYALVAFERLYQMGFPRDAVLSGDFPQAQIMAAGLSLWREAENIARPWRAQQPDLWWLAWYVCRREAQPK